MQLTLLDKFFQVIMKYFIKDCNNKSAFIKYFIKDCNNNSDYISDIATRQKTVGDYVKRLINSKK